MSLDTSFIHSPSAHQFLKPKIFDFDSLADDLYQHDYACVKNILDDTLLQGLLADPAEDIRLLAYSMMDAWEKDLTQRIQKAQTQLDDAAQRTNFIRYSTQAARRAIKPICHQPFF